MIESRTIVPRGIVWSCHATSSTAHRERGREPRRVGPSGDQDDERAHDVLGRHAAHAGRHLERLGHHVGLRVAPPALHRPRQDLEHLVRRELRLVACALVRQRIDATEIGRCRAQEELRVRARLIEAEQARDDQQRHGLHERHHVELALPLQRRA
jgi:hypothetical protein